MELIPRPQYTEKIASLINRGMMLILVGQRRVGKSNPLLVTRTCHGMSLQFAVEKITDGR